MNHLTTRAASGAACALLLATVATLTGAPALAAPVKSTPDKPGAPCFFITQWQGWKSPSPDVVYLGIIPHQVYRLDLSYGVPALQWPDMHLLSIVHNPASVCSAIELQLYVSDSHNDFRMPLIGRKLTKLTPEEVAAIPRKYLPDN